MEEIIYIGSYDNTIDLRLDSDGTAISTSSITRIDANIGGVDVTSTNESTDPIRWAQLDYVEGEIRCKLGDADGLVPFLGDMYIVVFDPTNPDGVVFGPIAVKAVQLP